MNFVSGSGLFVIRFRWYCKCTTSIMPRTTVPSCMAIRNTCPKIFPNYNLSRFISDMAPTCKKRILLDILPNDVDSATILDIEKEAMRLSLPDIPLHLLQGVTLGLLRWKLGHSYKIFIINVDHQRHQAKDAAWEDVHLLERMVLVVDANHSRDRAIPAMATGYQAAM